MKRMGEVGEFVKARQSICQDGTMLPQVAVLHSESHFYSNDDRAFPIVEEKTKPVAGGTFTMLENHYGVDILDEWALLPRLSEIAIVVAPEQDRMSVTRARHSRTPVEAMNDSCYSVINRPQDRK